MRYRFLLLFVPLCLFVGESRFTTGTAAEPTPSAFREKALPFLQKHCYQCHGDKLQKAEVKLSIFQDEAAVLKDRKLWEAVLRVVGAGEMPPPAKPRPMAAELDAFVKSVRDIFDRADKNAKPDPGRITIRRLNRTEYNNTIRDLIGVDFNPSEDFPSDDIGYGFDNIGDVLTLSPVLMERYLAASESIVNRAILPDPPKPPQRHISMQYTEPASATVPMKGRYRFLSTKESKNPVETGPVHTSYQVPADGEYIFRTKVYAECADAGVEVAILACGKTIPTPATDSEVEKLSGLSVPGLRPFSILKIVEVKAKDEKTAEVIEVKVPANIGVHRMAVAIVKRPKDKADATLFVESLVFEGPLDTRPASHRKLLAVDSKLPRREQTREVLQRFATRAYRRPATTDEIERLIKLAESVEKWEAGIQLAMQAVLVSPKFLFRVELDDRPDSPDAHAIDEFQLASRLSYFLWSSMPDQELFDLAAKKQLSANIDATVRRMLKDPKSSALVENFAMQWLQLRRLSTFAPDAKLFPNFNDKLRDAMLTETSMFFDAVMREDRSILELIDADFTFLNEPLSRHYGIADTMGNWSNQKVMRPGGQPIRGEKFVRVSLGGRERGGLITQASVLTVTSNPTRTSPVKRGRWVLEQILGTPPPPPPPNVPELVEGSAAELTGTLRQRMEQHRTNPNCASCHARMDPIGFAFENYNAIGAFRQKDGEFPIDPSGTLPDGKSFQGPTELKAILKDKKELFARNLTDKMMIYALGRGTEFFDKPTIDKIVVALERDQHKFSTLMIEIVKSDAFRMRRGKQ